jgi:toxin ParE1/3/4
LTLLLSREAARDYDHVVGWTAENFGARQAQAYKDLIASALREIASDPGCAGSRSREDVGPGYRTLHIARGRRRGRHLILYRRQNEDRILVVRILHESMDLPRHLTET